MPGAFLEAPWRALLGQSRALDDRAIALEYDALFGGVGKPEVALFGTHGDHVQPWVPRMCDAIEQHPRASFNAALAAFTRAFVAVEAQGFDLLE